MLDPKFNRDQLKDRGMDSCVAGVFFEIAGCFVVVLFKLHQTVSMLTLELRLTLMPRRGKIAC